MPHGITVRHRFHIYGKITSVLSHYYKDSAFSRIVSILKDYCLNSSLAGLRYIADDRYSTAERIFWFICIVISMLLSFNLINGYRRTFDSENISMVDEPLDVNELNVKFPSVAVCQFGNSKEEYPEIEAKIQGLMEGTDFEYSFDVEDFLIRVVFLNLYSTGSLSAYCTACDDCIPCPTSGYEEIAAKTRANCSQLFGKCTWDGQEFDCCKYFLPIQTTLGECFMINSLQLIDRDSVNWLPMSSSSLHLPQLQLVVNTAFAVYILNEEEIPHMMLNWLEFQLEESGRDELIKLHVQDIRNDPAVRYFKPKYRRCLFPDEQKPQSYFQHYSFSVCATKCVRDAQIRTCNCTHYNMVYEEDDKSLSCDYEGLLCLDKNELMRPPKTILQIWRKNGVACRCLPSCNENEIYVVERTIRINPNNDERSVTIGLQSAPLRHYRRQAVRSSLDLVVTVGGILGLFMGASILSGVELLYFFTVRVIGNFYLKWNVRKPRAAISTHNVR